MASQSDEVSEMASAEDNVYIMRAQVLNFNLSTLRSLASSMIRESEYNLDGDFSQRCFSPGNFIKNQIMDLRSLTYNVLIGDAKAFKNSFLLEGIDPALYQCKGVAAFKQDLINVMFTNENNNDHRLPVGVSGEEEMAYKKMLSNIIFGAENDDHDDSELYQLLMMGNDQSYLNAALIHAVLTCKCIGEPENEEVKKVDDSFNKPLDEELDIDELPYFPQCFGEPEKKEDKEVEDSSNKPLDEDSDIEDVPYLLQCIGEPEKKEDKEVDDSFNKPLDEDSDIEEVPYLLQCIGEPEKKEDKEVDDSFNKPLDEDSDIEEVPYLLLQQCNGEPEKKEDKVKDDSSNTTIDEDSDSEEVSNLPLQQCIGEPEKNDNKEVDNSSNTSSDEDSDSEEVSNLPLQQCIGEPEKKEDEEVVDSSNKPLDEESDIEEVSYPPPIDEKLELAVGETTPKNIMNFEACQVQAIVEKPELPVETSTKEEYQQFGETSPAKIMKLEKLHSIEEEIPEEMTQFTGLEYELINIDLLNLIRCKDAFNIEVGPDCTKEDLVKAIAEYKKSIESNPNKIEDFLNFWQSIP